jgi:transcription antitermination factor NusG
MKELQLPLFPSYVFVRDSLLRRPEILSTPGVQKMVMMGRQPAVIPEAEIDALRRAIENSRRVEPHPFLSCGERVRVKSGCLEGVEGILIRKKNFCRLVISVELLGRSAAVEIEAACVEAVSSQDRVSRSSACV